MGEELGGLAHGLARQVGAGRMAGGAQRLVRGLGDFAQGRGQLVEQAIDEALQGLGDEHAGGTA
ncbi:MAG: hypothetical protein MK041_08390 [Aquabacterium sp.]|nr:hypothetical protein [Aquabacterium sp.]